MNNRQPKDHGSRRQADTNNRTGDTNVAFPPEERDFAAPSTAGAEEQQPGPESKTPESDSIPLVNEDYAKEHVAEAAACRDVLVRHLRDSLLPGATPLTLLESAPPNDTAAARDERARRVARFALDYIHYADLVLWRSDLLNHAEVNADAFAQAPVIDADIPHRHELWCLYGRSFLPRMYGDTLALFQRLLITVAAGESGRSAAILGFHYLVEDGVLRLDKPPHVLAFARLDCGQPPEGIEDQRYLACLSFRAQPFVDDSPADVDYTRAERRRMEREGRTPPTVRIVNLRRKEPTAKQKADAPHLTDHQYQCQWVVKAHVRRPNPRMKEQRPIWVNSYVKGPEDKPLKPPTLKVIVVKR